jgi:hypothetical protein
MRRMAASALNTSVAQAYAPQYLDTALSLLHRIAARPDQFREAISDVNGAFLMRLAYGYNVVENDPLILIARESLRYFGQGLTLQYAVNDFPICESLNSATLDAA